MAAVATIDKYIHSKPKDIQVKLFELRELLRKVAPNAKEAIKWGSPVFEENRILFSFSAHKSHMNFMPTRRTLDHFRDELKDYKTGMDTIQFPYDKPLPKTLIKKIAAHRAKDVRENDSKWM
jgi:uncharacterized protein YdhG (YjbR/CyaY superfamily)